VMSGALAGAGNTLAAMALAIIAFWVLRLPVAWMLSIAVGLGPEGIFWAFPISNVAAGMIAVAWLVRGGWIRRVVGEDSEVGKMIRGETQVEEGFADA
jgi:Na+-driven multidrug efflux pump